MCAINSNGVLSYEIISGSYNGDIFKNFIEKKLIDHFKENKNSILIMDNCKFHHRSDVLLLLNENKISYKFLPPYSPQLNPIEEFFAVIKAKYKSIKPRPKSTFDIK